MEALWKQEVPLHPTFVPMNNCLREDWFLLPFELKLQGAHARALEAAGILSASECAQIHRALEQIDERYGGGSTQEYTGLVVGTAHPAEESQAEDLHTWMEGKLIELVGEAGKKIHTARSRNDQVATLLKMYVIDAGEDLSKQLRELIRTACRRAKDWSDLIFPLQTHCQFAAPGSVGFWALRYATALERVCRHVDCCMSLWRRFCPLGAGAVAGSSIPIDRSIQASGLGFEQPSPNALDATTTRDECLELLSLATQTALHLQSFATDVIVFSQTPFAWTIYPREFGTGSSMMPNKTNPDAMELLRGECNAILACQHQAILLMKGLPSGYNRDLQCIKLPLREAVTKLGHLCTMTRAFLERLDFDAKRLGESLQSGAIDATLRMEKKVLGGTPLREAHHNTASEVQGAAGPSDDADRNSADDYQTVGSASPSETRRVADELLSMLRP